MAVPPAWFWPAFLGGTAAIILFSWRISIRAKRYHGLARFFAFESILGLLLLNGSVWFRDPFSLPQIASWILLSASFFLAGHSVWIYLKLSAPRSEFEDSTRLVRRGAYRYIRHPMYSSLLLLAWGVFWKAPSWPGAALVAVATACLLATARAEERENLRFFGPAYAATMRQTKMFIPFLF